MPFAFFILSLQQKPVAKHLEIAVDCLEANYSPYRTETRRVSATYCLEHKFYTVYIRCCISNTQSLQTNLVAHCLALGKDPLVC